MVLVRQSSCFESFNFLPSEPTIFERFLKNCCRKVLLRKNHPYYHYSLRFFFTLLRFGCQTERLQIFICRKNFLRKNYYNYHGSLRFFLCLSSLWFSNRNSSCFGWSEKIFAKKMLSISLLTQFFSLPFLALVFKKRRLQILHGLNFFLAKKFLFSSSLIQVFLYSSSL